MNPLNQPSDFAARAHAHSIIHASNRTLDTAAMLYVLDTLGGELRRYTKADALLVVREAEADATVADSVVDGILDGVQLGNPKNLANAKSDEDDGCFVTSQKTDTSDEDIHRLIDLPEVTQSLVQYLRHPCHFVTQVAGDVDQGVAPGTSDLVSQVVVSEEVSVASCLDSRLGVSLEGEPATDEDGTIFGTFRKTDEGDEDKAHLRQFSIAPQANKPAMPLRGELACASFQCWHNPKNSRTVSEWVVKINSTHFSEIVDGSKAHLLGQHYVSFAPGGPRRLKAKIRALINQGRLMDSFPEDVDRLTRRANADALMGLATKAGLPRRAGAADFIGFYDPHRLLANARHDEEAARRHRQQQQNLTEFHPSSMFGNILRDLMLPLKEQLDEQARQIRELCTLLEGGR